MGIGKRRDTLLCCGFRSSWRLLCRGRAGSWAALDPATGKILWQKPDPNGVTDIGPMAVANGVVYARSGSFGYSEEHVRADAKMATRFGATPAGSSVNAGATIVSGTGIGLRIRPIGRFQRRQEILCLHGEWE